MKAESNIQPQAAFELNELSNGMTEVIFYENVEQLPGETARFLYDTYTVTVPSRVHLAADIADNAAKWLAFAKNRENIAPLPSQEERIAGLEAENKQLRAQNERMANTLDELIRSVLGGN